MGWKHKVNSAFTNLTGYTVARPALPRASAPKPATAKPAPKRRNNVVTPDMVRTPPDPTVARLVQDPVFVLCSVRSGSTLLRYLMNAHSQVHAPHELHLRRLSVQFGTKLSRQAMEVLGHNQADLEHLLWDRILHLELTRSGKTLIVDKTPSNVFIHDRLAAAWPSARFLFLIRHPLSIAESWTEANLRNLDEDAARRDALRYMRALERARTELGGLTVRYEDLTADPAAETRRITDFLGVDWEPEMLEYGQDGVFTKGLGDWKDKIQSGKVVPGRELPDEAAVPRELHRICRAWGYLPE